MSKVTKSSGCVFNDLNVNTPARCDELVTVGWLWEYAQYSTDERGYYGYETVITENNPTDHVSPAEKLRNIRELVTRKNAEEVIAAKNARIAELEAEREDIVRHIPMEYLKTHDADGAIGPTKELKLPDAMRDYSEARWHLFDRIKALEADNKRLREAMKTEKALADRLASALEYIDDYSLSYPDLGTVTAVAQPAIKEHSATRAALGEVKP